MHDTRMPAPRPSAAPGRSAEQAGAATRSGAAGVFAHSAAGPVGGAASGPRIRAMQLADIGAVHAVEASAYAFPWSRGNFVDSLAAAYPAWVIEGPDGELLGYLVAMRGVEEMHLLNVTVAPRARGRGHARALIEGLLGRCRADGVPQLWLEVRAGNARAQAIYTRLGFVTTGRRRGYYPASFGRREDALVMSLALAKTGPAGEEGGGDALG